MLQRNQRQLCPWEVCLLVRGLCIRFATLKSNNRHFSWRVIESGIIFLHPVHKTPANKLVVAEQWFFPCRLCKYVLLLCSSLGRSSKHDECLHWVNSCCSHLSVVSSPFPRDLWGSSEHPPFEIILLAEAHLPEDKNIERNHRNDLKCHCQIFLDNLQTAGLSLPSSLSTLVPPKAKSSEWTKWKDIEFFFVSLNLFVK